MSELRYHRPPLIEALCELHFDASGPYDETIPDQVHEALRSWVPERQVRHHYEVRLEGPVGETPPGVGPVLHTPRAFLQDTERQYVVQVAPHLIAISHLRPSSYSWDGFRPCILEALEAYLNAAHELSSRYPAIRQASLRFINHVWVPEEREAMEAALLFRPHLPPGLGKLDTRSRGLIAGTLFERDPLNTLRVQVVSLDSTEREDQLKVQLDLTHQSRERYEVEEGEAVEPSRRLPERLDAMHDGISEVFEACFSAAFKRQHFQPVEPGETDP